MTAAEACNEVRAEQPSSSMWSSNGSGVQEGVVKLEGGRGSAAESRDGSVIVWDIGGLFAVKGSAGS